MAWIELHEGIWEHHKTVKLSELLGITDVCAVGHLVSLWHFTLRNSPNDGSLEPWGDIGIEKAARWAGERGKFIEAVRKCGLLDEFTIHDWDKFTMHYMLSLERRERQLSGIRERVKKFRMKRSCNARVTKCNAATVPNLTIPNHTKPNERIGAFAPPALAQVQAYCQERGGKVDAEHWHNYYSSNGWRVGKNPMRDWKAAVRTWEKNGSRFGADKPRAGAAAPIPGKYGDGGN